MQMPSCAPSSCCALDRGRIFCDKLRLLCKSGIIGNDQGKKNASRLDAALGDGEN